MKNHGQIITELSYIDKFLSLLHYQSDHPHYDLLLNRIYHNYPQFIVQNQPEITVSQLHKWLENRFQQSSLTFFGDIIVGFYLLRGDITGQLSISDLATQSHHVIYFVNDLFQSPVINQVELAVILHDELPYLLDITDRLITLDELMKTHGVLKPNNQPIAGLTLSGKPVEVVQTPSDLTTGTIENIPYLKYPDGNLSTISKLDNLTLQYQSWRKAVLLVLQSSNREVSALMDQVIPVIIIASNSRLACMVHNYIGLSSSLVIDLVQLPSSSRQMLLLYTTIHEVAHLFCRPHSNRFYQITAQIFSGLLHNPDLDQFLNSK